MADPPSPSQSFGHVTLPSTICGVPLANEMPALICPDDMSTAATRWQVGYAMYAIPVGCCGHATPMVSLVEPAAGSAIIAAGRARIGTPLELVTGMRSTRGGVVVVAGVTICSADVMSSADRSHVPAFAVIS